MQVSFLGSGLVVSAVVLLSGGGGVGIDFRLSFSRDLQDMMRESLDMAHRAQSMSN